MKVNLFKIKEGKLNQWKDWCDLLMTKFKSEALETLKEEKVAYEGCFTFELNSEHYVLGLADGECLPASDCELNRQHKKHRQECLEFVKTLENNYELFAKPN